MEVWVRYKENYQKKQKVCSSGQLSMAAKTVGVKNIYIVWQGGGRNGVAGEMGWWARV